MPRLQSRTFPRAATTRGGTLRWPAPSPNQTRALGNPCWHPLSWWQARSAQNMASTRKQPVAVSQCLDCANGCFTALSNLVLGSFCRPPQRILYPGRDAGALCEWIGIVHGAQSERKLLTVTCVRYASPGMITGCSARRAPPSAIVCPGSTNPKVEKDRLHQRARLEAMVREPKCQQDAESNSA